MITPCQGQDNLSAGTDPMTWLGLAGYPSSSGHPASVSPPAESHCNHGSKNTSYPWQLIT